MAYIITKILITASLIVLISEIAKRSDKLGALSADKTIATPETTTQSVDPNSNFTVTATGSIIIPTGGGSAIQDGEGVVGVITIDGTIQTANAFLINLHNSTGVDGVGINAGDIIINGIAESLSSRGIYLNDYNPNNIVIGPSGLLSGRTLTIHVSEAVPSGRILN